MAKNPDELHPSQAEGEDPAADDSVEALAPQGHPSQAEGEDPRDEVHEVLDPTSPTSAD